MSKHVFGGVLPRNMSKMLLMIFAVSLCIVSSSRWSLAQNRNAGEIKGTVFDTSGAAVPGVAVNAKNTETGVVTHGVTGADGIYDLPYVVPGPYSVTFTRAGFEEFTQNNILLHVGTVTVNGKLTAGSVTTSVQVDSAQPLLQTETSDLQLTLSPKQLTELPNVGGNWTTYTELIPGVSGGRYNYSGGLATGDSVAFNGAQTFQSNWLLDGGVAFTPQASDPQNIQPPLDSIAEISVNTGNFGAESGNGTSVLNVITKSGSNQFHGAVWERIQNDYFQAKPYGFGQILDKNPPLRWNQYGFNLGGPFLKDKLFFFGSYQRQKNGNPTSYLTTVPTADQRLGIFDPAIFGVLFDPATTHQTGVDSSGNPIYLRSPLPYLTDGSGRQYIPKSRQDPTALNIQNYWPTANIPLTNGQNYRYVASTPSIANLYNYRVDTDLLPKNRVIASGMYAQTSYVNPYPGPSSDPSFFQYSILNNQVLGELTDVWTVSPNKVNEARFAVVHLDFLATAPTSQKGISSKIGLVNAPFDTFPHVNVYGGALAPEYQNGDLFAVQLLNTWTGSDTFSWTLGKHTMKFGGEWDYSTAVFQWQPISNGNFNFSGIATKDASPAATNGGVGYADFMLGAVDNWNIFIPVRPRATFWTGQGYAQDNYKVLPNLTLNLGMRFLYQTGFKEAHNRISQFQPNLPNPGAGGALGAIGYAGINIPTAIEKSKPFFMPRVGFAWTPRPNWVVRGGIGVYANQYSANNYTTGLGQGYSAQNAVSSPDGLTPSFLLKNGAPTPIYPTATSLTPDLLNGTDVSYQPYDTPISYSTQYQFGVQHQIGTYVLDVAYVGNKGSNVGFGTDHAQRIVLGANHPHPFPQYDSVYYNTFEGTSNYNSIQVQGKKQYAKGLTFQVSYTYAKNLDTGTGQGGVGVTGVDIYQDSYNPLKNYGPSSNDLRHVFNGSIVYELPFGKNRAFVNHGGVLDALIGGWQVSTAFQAHSGTPFTPFSANDNRHAWKGGTSFVNRVGKGTLSKRSIDKWFNYDDFTLPAINTFGNESRNILYGPNFSNVDLSAGKKFHIPYTAEKLTFELKADAVNALNHPSFGLPNAAIIGPAGGAPDDSLNQAAGVGSINSAFPMRNMQFSGTFRF